jgi:hypothetical protein
VTAQAPVRIADLDPDTQDLVRLIARAKRAKERQQQQSHEASLATETSPVASTPTTQAAAR